MYSILIVDDDCTMRKALTAMVNKVEDFEVCGTAANGKEGLELYHEMKPDIIFMDNMMPCMSGLEAIKNIRQEDDDVTIYLLSSYKNFDLASDAMRLKVKSYLSKPLGINTFVKVMQEYSADRADSYEEQISRLEEVIEDRDFRCAYYNYQAIISEIYDKYGEDTSKMKEALLSIERHMTALLGGVEGEVVGIENVYPFNNSLYMSKKAGVMWLFKVICYVFNQRSIKRYPPLKCVHEYIEEHLTEDIGLNQIITNCGISQGYLSRIFKDQFNVSVMEYLHMRKMHLAKCYMHLTNDSTAQIAYRLGYNESNYFCKVFKKYEHMTLQQYRKTIYGADKGERVAS